MCIRDRAGLGKAEYAPRLILGGAQSREVPGVRVPATCLPLEDGRLAELRGSVEHWWFGHNEVHALCITRSQAPRTQIGPKAVSYTHLDVYKRQAQQMGVVMNLRGDYPGHGFWRALASLDPQAASVHPIDRPELELLIALVLLTAGPDDVGFEPLLEYCGPRGPRYLSLIHI